MSLDDDLDDLYGVAPEEFTARRKELAAAAKKRGDADDTKAIAGARKPTAAAWVVNQLVRADPSARTRLSDLSEGLRAAHAEMDGPRIRELTTAQRKLVHELVRSAFEAADLADPSAAMRDDVTNTLQAAIADPEVAERLGRLAKPEQFSGFGDFGGFAAGAPEAAAASRKASKSSPPQAAPSKSDPSKAAPSKAVPSSRKAATKSVSPKPNPAELRAARRSRDRAESEAKAAKAAQTKAADAVDDVKATLASARRRYEKLLESLHAAEREVDAADQELKAAQRSAGEAAERVEAADTALAEAEKALAKIEGD
jgi:hypothetical protein